MMTDLRKGAAWLQSSLERKQLLKICLVAGLLIGLLGHAFMFTNKIPNHDDLEFYTDIEGAGLGLGRYVLYFIWKCFSDISTPWLNGVMGVLALGMAGFFLCDAYDLTRRWQVFAITVVMQLYPVNISTYCFMYQAHAFMLGVMFAAMAPWALVRLRGWMRYPLAALLVMLATGVYQVYVMFAIGLLILLVIRKVQQGQENAAHLWGFAVGCALCAVAGLALYLVGFKVITGVGGVQLRDYQGMTELGSLNLAAIPQKIRDAYEDVWRMYVSDVPDYVNGRMKLFMVPLFLLGIAGMAWEALRCFAQRKPLQGLLVIACVLLLPLACCGIYFMGDSIDAHINTLYPMILMMLLPAVSLRACTLPEGLHIRQLAVLAAAVLYLGYGVNCTVLSNQAYQRHFMSFTRAEHFANRLALRIEEVEGYHPMSPLRIWGHMNHDQDKSLLYFEYDIASRFLPFLGIRMELDYSWPYCAANMLSRVIGLPVTDAEEWQPENAAQLSQIEAMPSYPQEGSIAYVGDVLVVKFSDEY